MAGLYRIGIETFSYNEGAQGLYQKMDFVLKVVVVRVCGIMGNGMVI